MNIAWLTDEDKIGIKETGLEFVLINSAEKFIPYFNQNHNMVFSSEWSLNHLEEIKKLFSLTNEKFYLYDTDHTHKDMHDGIIEMMFSENHLYSYDKGKYVTCFDAKGLLKVLNSKK